MTSSAKQRELLEAAYHDSQGQIPKKYLVLITVHRCGSTWLMDALRAHPEIYIEPRAFLHNHLLLRGNRYPADLLSDKDEALSIELQPDIGGKIPLLASHQQPGRWKSQLTDESFAIEKIHPTFYKFDIRGFLQNIAQMQKAYNVEFKYIYQIRDPQSVISSFIKYKRRNPNWHQHVAEEEVPELIYNELLHIYELAKEIPGIIVDYANLTSDFEGALKNIFKHIWPSRHNSEFKKYIYNARIFTSKDKRLNTNKDLFLGLSLEDEKLGTLKPQQSNCYLDNNENLQKAYNIYEHINKL